MSASESDDKTYYESKNNGGKDIQDEERKKIRENLSILSFEELIKMKETLGSKVYNETVFGINKMKRVKKDLKRANKNRPREVSSKIRPRCNVNLNLSVKKQSVRDPRFDPLCGTFDDKIFRSNYKFVNSIQKNEKKQLESEYKECKDPERKKRIKYLIQRMDNKLREQQKNEIKENKKDQENKEISEKLKRGEKPIFKKKSVKRLENLIEKYEELKKNKKLQKHIEKRSKKLSQKDKKKNR